VANLDETPQRSGVPFPSPHPALALAALPSGSPWAASCPLSHGDMVASVAPWGWVDPLLLDMPPLRPALALLVLPLFYEVLNA